MSETRYFSNPTRNERSERRVGLLRCRASGTWRGCSALARRGFRPLTSAAVTGRHLRPRRCRATIAERSWLHTVASDPVPLQEGDSARSLRSRRNGARRRPRDGEKEGRRKKKFRNPKTYLRRPSFSLFDPVRDAPFRETRQR